jgi:hypothetical protein
MWPVSDKFNKAIHNTHRVVILAELWSAGQTSLLDPGLNVVGGSVTIDRTANIRRTATLQIVDDARLFSSIGKSGQSGLEPYGNEVVLYRGIGYSDGTQEMVPLGVFPINETDLTETSSGRSVTLTLTDRSRLVSENKFVTTYTIASGTSFLTAAQVLVDYTLPYDVAVTKDVEAVTPTTTSGMTVFHESDDPWAAFQKLCAAVGLEGFFGPTGQLRIRDVPDPTAGSPIFTYLDNELSILLGVDRKLARNPNGVLLTSSASNASPVRSLQYDSNPSSPSYYYGPYGQFTDFYADPLVTSQSQADVAAKGRLNKILGLAESISLSVIPHPAQDAGDIVHATRLVDGLDTDFVIDQITIPLDATSAATVSGRTRIPPA